tara:strand:- start:10773 stop:11006 length:234 start_codon:yes stop_codon:yes gene_type:complete
MDESQIVDIWMVFKESIETKKIEAVAERYVDICADYGTSDESFREALGSCTELDSAINYYLDDDWDDDDDYNNEWED